mmetsp:Transcript_10363/g.33470  ORF Transcript_10363/g.33470 Transcript_10363/m.33470 type:complete len:265 (-) Transcript_10363:1468-2262(-)
MHPQRDLQLRAGSVRLHAGVERSRLLCARPGPLQLCKPGRSARVVALGLRGTLHPLRRVRVRAKRHLSRPPHARLHLQRHREGWHGPHRTRPSPQVSYMGADPGRGGGHTRLVRRAPGHSARAALRVPVRWSGRGALRLRLSDCVPEPVLVSRAWALPPRHVPLPPWLLRGGLLPLNRRGALGRGEGRAAVGTPWPRPPPPHLRLRAPLVAQHPVSPGAPEARVHAPRVFRGNQLDLFQQLALPHRLLYARDAARLRPPHQQPR